MTNQLLRSIGRAILDALRPSTGRPSGSRRSGTSDSRRRSAQRTPSAADYPGDFTGRPELTYAPHPGKLADPGEIVWTWVPYEEDHSQGKDRPVLIVGRDADWLLGLPLTSQDHDLDAAQEAGEGRYWVDIGTGNWDSSGRASEVRVNRIVRIAPNSVRRIAGKLDADRFNEVAEGVRQHR
ncbi:MAG TPA: type II toxin-antitoxin system PemK/MazF family toxin [Propionicimonas sp.]|nr:type II toxin-antitoxin system PemK/MazF family toxin [Propionicimonas sp.]HRA05847.1 type II toxin-antitoxin system PemK/MazF family toxin [Propionicimonas sp.]